METISMSVQQRRRLEVMSRTGSGAMSLVEAREILKRGYRQMRRVWSRYQAEGDSGLVHRGRGRSSNRLVISALVAPEFGFSRGGRWMTSAGCSQVH